MSERRILLLIVGVFLAAYYVPVEHPRVQSALLESFFMLQDYARAHVLSGTLLVISFALLLVVNLVGRRQPGVRT